jgi:hypothetical protein
MTKKGLGLVAGTLAFLASAGLFGAVVIPGNRPGTTKANFDRIKKGMPRADMEAILGQRKLEGDAGVVGIVIIWWAEDSSQLWVIFNNGVVTDMCWKQSDQTLLEKIRRTLHLP